MQTFLPYPDYKQSAQCLDRQRLGKQRVECLQLLKALNGETRGWVNHPATKMWADNIEALIVYGIEICKEWISRGYKDTCLEKIRVYGEGKGVKLFSSELNASHRASLLAKNYDHYKRFNWREEPKIDYVWN